MDSTPEGWLERMLEDESWRRGLTDAQAERLLRWALARIGPDPGRTGAAVRRAMRRIREVVQASGEEAAALLLEWEIRPPPEWASWPVEERLAWTLEALASWRP